MEAIFPGSVLGSGPQKHWSLPLDSMKVESTGAVRKKGIVYLKSQEFKLLLPHETKKGPFVAAQVSKTRFPWTLGIYVPNPKTTRESLWSVVFLET